MIDLSHQAETLARRLAAAEGLSVEEAVRQALEARARAAGVGTDGPALHDRSPGAVAARQARIDRIVAEIAALPVLDARSPNEIMDDLNAT
jgi:antitoxin VapB